LKIPFCKYQGTGNDFVLIDQRKHQYINKNDTNLIQKCCDRKYGIGADGLILLQNKEGFDFEMIYFNADGNESSMCGNGGRCIIAFAHKMGIKKKSYHFMAIDGAHEATYSKNAVALKMSDVTAIEEGDGYFLLDTGSPHYIVFNEDNSDLNIVEAGQGIRYSKRFKDEGVNVNFVEIKSKNEIDVATYERGVEDETLSCGTGVTAAAICFNLYRASKLNKINITTKGGNLKVQFDKITDYHFQNIWLIGSATFVYEGKIDLI
jgi:diaminopimelate epimerase